MKYWLLKSEPQTFSIDDLANKTQKIATWDGVRNYQARNMLRDELQKDDLAFFYHSSCDVPGIVGVMRVVKAGYPDPTQLPQDNSRWYAVDVQLVKKFSRVITLTELRLLEHCEQMLVLRKGNRLSVTPVTPVEWRAINDFIGENDV